MEYQNALQATITYNIAGLNSKKYTMQDEAKIQALLATNTPENQILAVQLIQSQWHWLLEEALVYVVDFYCLKNETEIILYLENTVVTYLLEIVDDYHFIMGAEVLLTFKLEQEQKIIRQNTLVNKKIALEENKFLSDYQDEIKAHFEEELPQLLALFVNL